MYFREDHIYLVTSDLKYTQLAQMPQALTLSIAQGVIWKGDIFPTKAFKPGEEHTQLQDLKFTLKASIKSNSQENLFYYDNSSSWQPQTKEQRWVKNVSSQILISEQRNSALSLYLIWEPYMLYFSQQHERERVIS